MPLRPFPLSLVLLGALIVVAQVVPVAIAAWFLARRAVADDAPVLRVAAAGFVALCEVLFASQFLLAIGLYSRWWVLGGSWLAAAVTFAIATRIGVRGEDAGAPPDDDSPDDDSPDDEPTDDDDERAPAEEEPGRPDRVVGGVVDIGTVVLVVFAGVVAFVSALLKPSLGTDAVNYHLPDIAVWLRTGSLWQIDQFQVSVFQNAYPQNAELIAAWFVAPVGRDVFVNLGPVLQMALCVASIAAFAETLKVRRTTAVLIGVVGAFAPVIATANIGSVGSDLLPFACLMLSLTFWMRWRERPSTVDLVLGGLALGVTAGSKITALLYVAAFGVGWLAVLLRRRRWIDAFVVLPLVVIAPAFIWYLRNLVVAGNPLWGFEFLGFPGGYFRAGTGDEWSILRYLVQRVPDSLATVVVGYAAGLFAIVPLLLFGAKSWWRGLRGPGDMPDRARIAMFGIVPLVVLLAMWAQQWTSGDDGYNVPASGRYVVTTFVVWFVLAMAAALAGRNSQRWRVALLVAAVAQVAVTFLSPVLPTYRISMRAVAVGFVAALLVAIWFAVRNRIAYRPDPVFVAVVVIVLVILALPLGAKQFWQNRYLRVEGLDPVLAAAANWKDSTIAVAGLADTYPLYGDDLSNRVIWVGDGAAQRPWSPGSEAEWIAALQAACVDHLVVVDRPEGWLSQVDEVRFTRGRNEPSLPTVLATTEPFRDKAGRPTRRFTAVYDVTGQPAGCDTAAGNG